MLTHRDYETVAGERAWRKHKKRFYVFLFLSMPAMLLALGSGMVLLVTLAMLGMLVVYAVLMKRIKAEKDRQLAAIMRARDSEHHA